MNPLVRLAIHNRFAPLLDEARSRSEDAVAASRELLATEPDPIKWTAALQAADVEIAVFRALNDAEAISCGFSRATPREDETMNASSLRPLEVNLMNAAVDICLMCFKQVPIVPGTRDHGDVGLRRSPCLAMAAIEKMISESLR